MDQIQAQLRKNFALDDLKAKLEKKATAASLLKYDLVDDEASVEKLDVELSPYRVRKQPKEEVVEEAPTSFWSSITGSRPQSPVKDPKTPKSGKASPDPYEDDEDSKKTLKASKSFAFPSEKLVKSTAKLNSMFKKGLEHAGVLSYLINPEDPPELTDQENVEIMGQIANATLLPTRFADSVIERQRMGELSADNPFFGRANEHIPDSDEEDYEEGAVITAEERDFVAQAPAVVHFHSYDPSGEQGLQYDSEDPFMNAEMKSRYLDPNLDCVSSPQLGHHLSMNSMTPKSTLSSRPVSPLKQGATPQPGSPAPLSRGTSFVSMMPGAGTSSRPKTPGNYTVSDFAKTSVYSSKAMKKANVVGFKTANGQEGGLVTKIDQYISAMSLSKEKEVKPTQDPNVRITKLKNDVVETFSTKNVPSTPSPKKSPAASTRKALEKAPSSTDVVPYYAQAVQEGDEGEEEEEEDEPEYDAEVLAQMDLDRLAQLAEEHAEEEHAIVRQLEEEERRRRRDNAMIMLALGEEGSVTTGGGDDNESYSGKVSRGGSFNSPSMQSPTRLERGSSFSGGRWSNASSDSEGVGPMWGAAAPVVASSSKKPPPLDMSSVAKNLQGAVDAEAAKQTDSSKHTAVPVSLLTPQKKPQSIVQVARAQSSKNNILLKQPLIEEEDEEEESPGLVGMLSRGLSFMSTKDNTRANTPANSRPGTAGSPDKKPRSSSGKIPASASKRPASSEKFTSPAAKSAKAESKEESPSQPFLGTLVKTLSFKKPVTPSTVAEPKGSNGAALARASSSKDGAPAGPKSTKTGAAASESKREAKAGGDREDAKPEPPMSTLSKMMSFSAKLGLSVKTNPPSGAPSESGIKKSPIKVKITPGAKEDNSNWREEPANGIQFFNDSTKMGPNGQPPRGSPIDVQLSAQPKGGRSVQFSADEEHKAGLSPAQSPVYSTLSMQNLKAHSRDASKHREMRIRQGAVRREGGRLVHLGLDDEYGLDECRGYIPGEGFQAETNMGQDRLPDYNDAHHEEYNGDKGRHPSDRLARSMEIEREVERQSRIISQRSAALLQASCPNITKLLSADRQSQAQQQSRSVFDPQNLFEDALFDAPHAAAPAVRARQHSAGGNSVAGSEYSEDVQPFRESMLDLHSMTHSASAYSDAPGFHNGYNSRSGQLPHSKSAHKIRQLYKNGKSAPILPSLYPPVRERGADAIDSLFQSNPVTRQNSSHSLLPSQPTSRATSQQRARHDYVLHDDWGNVADDLLYNGVASDSDVHSIALANGFVKEDPPVYDDDGENSVHSLISGISQLTKNTGAGGSPERASSAHSRDRVSRSQTAKEKLREKLLKRYSGDPEGEFNAKLKQAEYEENHLKETQSILHDYMDEIDDWDKGRIQDTSKPVPVHHKALEEKKKLTLPPVASHKYVPVGKVNANLNPFM